MRIFHGTILPSSTLPQAHIDLQGTIGKNKRLISGGIICAIGDDETCSLNFTGEKSLNAESYFWSLGNGNTSEKENPSTEKYQLGNHHVILRVLSTAGVSSEAFYDIQVVKKFDSEEKKCENCEKMKGKIQISAVFPNPPHADTVEWIELKNLSSESYSLDACVLSDDTRNFTLSGTISPGKTLRLRQIQTGITLGNSHDKLEIHCGDFLIDSFSWDFDIPSGYILRREMLDTPPVQVPVVSVVD
ncbi:MAG: hypothetical protein WCK88_00585 [bacterium]